MADSIPAVLAGDVGGTKTLLALYDGSGRRAQERYPSGAFRDLETMVTEFLGRHPAPRPDRACFGVAGRVEQDRARVTNLPWSLDARALERALGLREARLINDFVAVAEAIPHLAIEDLVSLQAGEPDPEGNLGVLGAGTGLGEALLVRAGGGYRIVASEGGHADFAARDEREAALWAWLHRELEHVSYERVLSGRGLYACYQFLCEHRGRPPAPEVRQRLAVEDPAAVVSHLASTDRDPIAVEAVDLFTSIYGAEAGNLALRALATGGVYVAGGIAVKILPAMQAGAFLRAFNAKGRFRSFCERVPVKVIVNPEAGLLGARAVAERL